MTSITKQSFYKTFEEKLLAHAVDYLYNEYVGGNENHFLDTRELLYNFDEKELTEIILKEILETKTQIWLDNGLFVEPKHLRFMGKKRIKEIVDHRVEVRHTREPWYWEN